MIWQPYLLAIIFGLAVSGAIYAAFLWPRVEPPYDGDNGDDEPPVPVAPPGPGLPPPVVVDGDGDGDIAATD